VIKNDGAGYFISAKMKGYLAEHHTLMKTISVGRSNSNRVERLNRSIRSFLDRQGLKWSTPKVIYELNLYLNCTLNVKNTKKHGTVTPYELQNGFLPDTPRFLGVEKPHIGRQPIQSVVKFIEHTAEMNSGIKVKPLNKTRYYVGKRVHYRKFGRKSSELKPATIINVGDETCTLDNGYCHITRNFSDIIG